MRQAELRVFMVKYFSVRLTVLRFIFSIRFLCLLLWCIVFCFAFITVTSIRSQSAIDDRHPKSVLRFADGSRTSRESNELKYSFHPVIETLPFVSVPRKSDPMFKMHEQDKYNVEPTSSDKMHSSTLEEKSTQSPWMNEPNEMHHQALMRKTINVFTADDGIQSPRLTAEKSDRSISLHDGNISFRVEVDTLRRVWQPWWNDPQCSQHVVRFCKKAQPRALASYPGSGNTWTRYLIETASGIHTGSLYRDDSLYLNGFRGEMEYWNAGTTLLQKVHEYDPPTIQQFGGRAVVLLRNPYRAILSYHNFIFGSHHGFAPVSNFRRKDWDTFLHIQVKSWLMTAMAWLQNGTEVHVLHFEQLQQDPATSLEQLLPKLGISVTQQRLLCLTKHSTGHFLRHKEYVPEDVRIFSPEIRGKIDRAIRYVDYLLRKRKLPELPLQLYEFYNNTHSDMMEVVACEKGRTVAECDIFVDELNRKSRNKSSSRRDHVRIHHSIISADNSKASREVMKTDGLSSGSVVVGNSLAEDKPKPSSKISPSYEEAPLGDTRLSLMEKVARLPITRTLENTLFDWLKPLGNPVTSMVKDPSTLTFMSLPLHFESQFGPEARQIAEEHVWGAPVAQGRSV